MLNDTTEFLILFKQPTNSVLFSLFIIQINLSLKESICEFSHLYEVINKAFNINNTSCRVYIWKYSSAYAVVLVNVVAFVSIDKELQ